MPKQATALKAETNQELTTPDKVFAEDSHRSSDSHVYPSNTPSAVPAGSSGNGIRLSFQAIVGVGIGILLLCAVFFVAGLQAGKSSSGTTANGFAPGGNGQMMGTPPSGLNGAGNGTGQSNLPQSGNPTGSDGQSTNSSQADDTSSGSI